ncbi:MAG: cyclic nucleotide-binding domain-containing protein [Acidobacteriota bacterium]
MESEALGKSYPDGEVIIKEGETGDRMFVIQKGAVDVSRRIDGRDVSIARLTAGDVFGEMAIFEREVRSATVRAAGEVRLLSIDRAGFLRKVHEDPSLAYRVLQQLSRRIRQLSEELARLKRG